MRLVCLSLPPSGQKVRWAIEPEQVTKPVNSHHDDVLRRLRGYEVGEYEAEDCAVEAESRALDALRATVTC